MHNGGKSGGVPPRHSPAHVRGSAKHQMNESLNTKTLKPTDLPVSIEQLVRELVSGIAFTYVPRGVSVSDAVVNRPEGEGIA